jgi:UDP-N-acetylglucosamine 2-epimerase (non-hydrolysing)
MKIAPIYRVMRERSTLDPILIHTGQHFDKEMSADSLDALELPSPHEHLGVGKASPAQQMGEILKRLEPIIRRTNSQVTVVVGDVNSTLAAALTASTLNVPIAHVEAGLRSWDCSMPEERNRVLVDRMSHFLFTPSEDANENLLREGIDLARIFLVGNVMIDSLDWMLSRASPPNAPGLPSVADQSFGLVTLHRPSNVDDPSKLAGILDALAHVAREVPLIFPVHPRTRQRIDDYGLSLDPRIYDVRPLAYGEFVTLLAQARIVLTDSGGIQEEAIVLGVPCLTLRHNTERPITLGSAGNELVGDDPDTIIEAARRRLREPPPTAKRPPLWDGRASERIVDILARSSGKLG